MVRETKMPRDWFRCFFVIFLNVVQILTVIWYTLILTLETSAFQSLYGGQFTLSTPLINQIVIIAMCTDQEIIKVREWIPHIGPLTRVIHLNLFLDMVPSSSANLTRALRGQPRRPYTQGHAKIPETKWRQMWKKSPLIRVLRSCAYECRNTHNIVFILMHTEVW